MEVRARPKIGTSYGRFAARQAGLLLQRLVALDDLWTAELEVAAGAGELPEETVQALVELVHEMENGLGKVDDFVGDLRLLLNELDDQSVESAFGEICESQWAPPSLTKMLTGEMTPDFTLRGAMITACDFVVDIAESEGTLLSSKMSLIVREQRIPDGDFGFPFRCALLLALVGAGVVLAVSSPAAPTLVTLAVVQEVGLGALGWMGANCPTQLPKISFRRREAKADPSGG
jgi:hypothetical protein